MHSDKVELKQALAEETVDKHGNVKLKKDAFVEYVKALHALEDWAAKDYKQCFFYYQLRYHDKFKKK